MNRLIYIIRHGQTDKNAKNELQGRRNVPLNERGRRQAVEAGAYFRSRQIRFDKVYSSPLIRAVETADIVTGGTVPAVTDERLIEMDYGPYEGLDLTDPPAEVVEFFSDFVHHPAPEGMEQLTSVVKRAGEFLDDLAGNAGDAGTILISTHAIAMKGLLEYLTPDARGRYWSTYIGNCSIYRTEEENGTFSVPYEAYPGS